MPIPASEILGFKITVRDMLPFLKDACDGGVASFFNSIMPQEDGQNPLDRELFVNFESMDYIGWSVSHTPALRGISRDIQIKLREHHQQSPLPLSPSDPLYPTMLYMTNCIGNVIRPTDKIDFSDANDFCDLDCDVDCVSDDYLNFTRQFSRLNVFGMLVHVPQYVTCIDYTDQNDCGRFELGGTEYDFEDPRKTRIALFECDGKRHNVAKFYTKKFFEHQRLVEKQIKKECGK